MSYHDYSDSQEAMSYKPPDSRQWGRLLKKTQDQQSRIAELEAEVKYLKSTGHICGHCGKICRCEQADWKPETRKDNECKCMLNEEMEVEKELATLRAENERLKAAQGRHCACEIDDAEEGFRVWCGTHAELRDRLKRIAELRPFETLIRANWPKDSIGSIARFAAQHALEEAAKIARGDNECQDTSAEEEK